MTDPLLVGAHGAIDRLLQLSRELRECPSCQGAGMVPLGEHRVTHDMAIDAGELSLEGTPCGCEFGPCDQCGGGGLVDSDVANEIDRAVLALGWRPIDVSFKQGIVSDGATYVCAAYPDSIGAWTAWGGDVLTPQPVWWFPYPEMPK